MPKIDSDYYKFKAINNSSLSLINEDEGGSIDNYLNFINNPDNFKKTSGSLFLGEKVHLYLLNPDQYVNIESFNATKNELIIFEELVAENKFDEVALLRKFKEKELYQNWKDITIIEKITPTFNKYVQAVNEGKLIVDADTYSKVLMCKEAVKVNKTASEFIYNSNNIIEQGYYSIDDVTGLKVKFKPDIITINDDHINIIDIKTSISNPYTFFFKKDPFGNIVYGPFFNYRYYRQCAFYKDFLIKELNTDLPVNCYIILFETKNNGKCTVIKIHDSYIEMGKQEYRRLLSKVNQALLVDYVSEELMESPIISL